MPAQQQHWIRTAFLSGATGPVAAGKALVSNGTRYVVATAANRASYGRAEGIAISSGDDDDVAIEIQSSGVAPNSVTGLGAGSAAWVIVSSTGALERDATPDAGEDVIGRCNARGDLFIQPGVWDETNTLGSAVTTPGGSTGELQYNDAGAFAGLAGVTIPVVGSGLQFANGYFLWSRDSFDALSVSLIGLDTDDVIRIGSSLAFGYPGFDVEIDVGVSQAIRIKAQELSLCANNLQIGRYAGGVIDCGGGIGVVGLDDASTLPSTNPTGGIIIYSDAGVWKWRVPSGTAYKVLGESGSGVIAHTATSISATGDARCSLYSDIAHVQTTDATATSAFTWTIPDEAVSTVTVEVDAVKSDGTVTGSWIYRARIKRDGGTVTVSTPVEVFSDVEAGFSTCVVTIDNSTSTGRVRVTGVAATTIDWSAVVYRKETTHA